MQHILSRFGIDLEAAVRDGSPAESPPEFVKADGCVLLLEEYRRSEHVYPQQFPDRTGYECFVNHVHYDSSSKAALENVLARAAIMRTALRGLRDGNLEIIISVSGDVAVLRFHKCREGEKWLTDNLDEYGSEGILTMEVDT